MRSCLEQAREGEGDMNELVLGESGNGTIAGGLGFIHGVLFGAGKGEIGGYE